MKLKKIFFIIFVGIYTNIQAQGLKVTHMEGTYDLDGDGLKEFASIETSNLRSRDISVVRSVSYTHLTLPTTPYV